MESVLTVFSAYIYAFLRIIEYFKADLLLGLNVSSYIRPGKTSKMKSFIRGIVIFSAFLKKLI